MGKLGAYAACLLATIWVAACPPLAASDQVRDAARSAPVLLLLHGGGFIFDDPSRMAAATEIARRLGFRPVYVDYPEFDLPAAVRLARSSALALRDREVYAYGDSAGGTLAALLAERDLVEAAAGYSPVANLRRFADHFDDPDFYMELIRADRSLLLHHSPGLYDSDRPILAMKAADDQAYMRDAVNKWAARDPQVQSLTVGGPHSGFEQPARYERNVARALRWLVHRRGDGFMRP